MEPLISIIIPKFQDDKYFTRCINSILRQTYKKIEIIVADKDLIKNFGEIKGIRCVENSVGDVWQMLNEAIQFAKGEYLFFCDVSGVLSPNLLKDIVEMANDSLAVAEVYKMDDNMLHLDIKNEFSITGKLFDKAIILERKIVFKNDEVCPEYSFLTQYTKACKNIRNSKKTLYEHKEEHYFNLSKMMDVGRIKRCIVDLQEGTLSEEGSASFISSLFEEVEKYDRRDDSKRIDYVEMATTVLEHYSELPELNYELAKRYIKSIFLDCIDRQDEIVWGKLQKYFYSIKNEYLLRVILDYFELDIERYEYLRSCTLKEYMFYQRNIPKKEEVNSNEKILEAIQLLNEKIDAQELKTQTNVVKEVCYQNQFLQGVELGEYVLSEYKEGRLGVKYIIKFLFAWIKKKL